MLNKLLRKHHVRYVDMLLYHHAGQKPVHWFVALFISVKKYNDIVEAKYTALDDRTKGRIFNLVKRDKKHKAKAWKRRS